MTPVEAKEITLAVWRYLAEHPDIKRKRNLPWELWVKIKHIEGECPLCELYRSCHPEPICPECPLKSCIEGSLYAKWFFMRDLSDSGAEAARKEAAQGIVGIVQAWEPI